MTAIAEAEQTFGVVQRADYPRLAWLFELGERPVLHCGASVEVFDNGAFEGCWDAPFESLNFAERANVFGSGVVRRGREWLFCPPSHTLDALYVLVHRGRAHVSNSIVPLFEHTGVKLDPRVNYTKLLISCMRGLDRADKVIWRGQDVALYRVLFNNFTIENGVPREQTRTEAPHFPDFETYRRYLFGTVEACVENAADLARRTPFRRIVSTCSAGYDSSTATAISKAVGGQLVLALKHARGGGADSGGPVATALGLPCVERERQGVGQGENDEIEWFTPGNGGGDYPLASFADELRGTVMLSGFLGDKMWSLTSRPDTVIGREDPSGCSMADFRLRVGFLHIPVPYIGALRGPEIHALGHSAEMKPFSVGGDYDRPIPRRILESAGVPRELVGQRKQAIATFFSWSPKYLSPETRARFDAWLRERGLFGYVRRELPAFQAAALGFRVIRKSIKLLPLLQWPLGPLRDRLERRFRNLENSRYANLLFVWSVERAVERMRSEA